MLRLVRLIEGWVLGAVMILISFGYGANVLIREALPSFAPNLAWIEEVCLIGLAWMVFLGLAMGLEQGRQIAMTSALMRMGDTQKMGQTCRQCARYSIQPIPNQDWLRHHVVRG